MADLEEANAVCSCFMVTFYFSWHALYVDLKHFFQMVWLFHLSEIFLFDKNCSPLRLLPWFLRRLDHGHCKERPLIDPASFVQDSTVHALLTDVSACSRIELSYFIDSLMTSWSCPFHSSATMYAEESVLIENGNAGLSFYSTWSCSYVVYEIRSPLDHPGWNRHPSWT